MVVWKDLGIGLRIGIFGGWISLIIFGLTFLIGFIDGVMV